MKKCYICNKDLENAETYYFDCEKYTCNNCYELYHKPKYNEIQRNELINHYQKLQTQKTIECLKEVVKKLYDEFESGTFITDKGKEYYGSYVKYCLILDFVIDKLKALGLEGDDIFVDNILKELEEGK